MAAVIISNLFRILLALVVGIGICIHGLSVTLHRSYPDVSWRIDPFNTDSLVRHSMSKLRAGPSKDELPILMRDVERALDTAPGHAPLYSIRGALHILLGDNARGQADFEKTLNILPTEILALLNLLRLDVGVKNYPKAVARLDLFMRRWNKRFDDVWPVMLEILATAEGREEIKRLLVKRPPWRKQLIFSLLKTGPGISLAQSILLNERQQGLASDRGEISRVLWAMLSAGSHQAAYNFFLLTLQPERLEGLGFVFNSDFGLTNDSSPFDWRITRKSGAVIDVVEKGETSSLQLRFLNSPASSFNVSQQLVLRPQLYELRITMSASNLETPLGLSWRLYCWQTAIKLANAKLPQGDFDQQVVVIRFSVPPQGCGAQTLKLETETKSKSWSHRYKGKAEFHKVEVVTVQN